MSGLADLIDYQRYALSAIHLIGISLTNGNLRNNKAGQMLVTPDRRKELRGGGLRNEQITGNRS